MHYSASNFAMTTVALLTDYYRSQCRRITHSLAKLIKVERKNSIVFRLCVLNYESSSIKKLATTLIIGISIIFKSPEFFPFTSQQHRSLIVARTISVSFLYAVFRISLTKLMNLSLNQSAEHCDFIATY